MEFNELMAAQGAATTFSGTDVLGAPQKTGVSVSNSIGSLELSGGVVEYRGSNTTGVVTGSGAVIVTDKESVTEIGVYGEFKSNRGQSDEAGRPSFVIEVGVIPEGDTITDAGGVTIGPKQPHSYI